MRRTVPAALSALSLLLAAGPVRAQTGCTPAFAPGPLQTQVFLPDAIALADVDDDNLLDVLTAGGNQVTLNRSLAGATSFAAGSGARSISLGDINDDGREDVAVASDLAGSVTVATLDPAGSPTVHDTISSLSSPHTVVLRHLDLDPHVDLLVSEPGAGQISIWRNVGAPSYDFASAGALVTGGAPPTVFVAEDLDRDGDIDVAALVGTGASTEIAVWRQDGPLSFTGLASFPVGYGATGFAVTDMNGDGHADVVVSSDGTTAVPAVQVLLGNGLFGFTAAGGFALPVTTAGPLAVGDFDGDSLMDVVVVTQPGAEIHVGRGNGLGGFKSAAMPVAIAGFAPPTAVAVGDLDNAGRADFVVGGQSIVGAYVRVENTSACTPTIQPERVPLLTSTTRRDLDENVLEWIAPRTGPFAETMVRWTTSTNCGMVDWTPTTGTLLGVFPGYPGGKHRVSHPGVAFDQHYCYAAFPVAHTHAQPRTALADRQMVSAFPVETPATPRWAYATGALSLTPPAILPGGDYVGVSNDRFLHTMKAGLGGGDWPAPYTPVAFDEPVFGRTTIVSPITTTVFGSKKIALAGGQDGRVYAIDVPTGRLLWASADLGLRVNPSVSAMVTDFGGAANLVFAAVSVTATEGALVALDLLTGAEVWRFDGGVGTELGAMNGQPAVVYPGAVVFATRDGLNPSNVFRLDVTGTGATVAWEADVPNVDAGVVVRNGVAYVGDLAGAVRAFPFAAAGDITPTWTRGTGLAPPGSDIFDGGIKDLWVDAAAGLVYASTLSTVHGIGLDGTYAWAEPRPSPSAPLQIGGTVYVGESGNQLTALDRLTGAVLGSVTLGDVAVPEVIGRPSYDGAAGLLVVGTESGRFYALGPF